MDARSEAEDFARSDEPPAQRLDVAVVGGGVSGLSAAFELLRRRPGLSLAVLEAQSEPGGRVRSTSEQGYTFDWGPLGFAPAAATFALVERLGLTGSLLPASPVGRARYIYRDGGLRKVPLKPAEFLTSELLSPAGKLRAALEPLLGSRAASRLPGNRRDGEQQDESVYHFAQRHFGREVAELAATLVLGVTAGDARRLSVASLFPAMARMERSHGSLVRAMLAARRERGGAVGRGEAAAGNGPPPGTSAVGAGPSRGASPSGAGASATGAPRAGLYGFRQGMGELTEALARHLGDSLWTDSGVKSLSRASDGDFELELEGAAGNGRGAPSGRRIRARELVLCTPAHVTSRLLEDLLPEAAHALAEIPYPDVDVFALGFDRIDVPSALDGFGLLVPRGEGVRSLGVLWSSALYPQRSPAGTALLRVIAGGVPDPSLPGLSDEEALAVVARDLRVTMGVTATPRFVRRLRLARAIPQYELGHGERVERALRSAREYGRLYLGGNALFGVGVNDCVRDAERLAAEVLG